MCVPPGPAQRALLGLPRPPSNLDLSSAFCRIYQVWQGNEAFYCGGRLMMGPNRGNVLFTTALIGVPAVVFLGERRGHLGLLAPTPGRSLPPRSSRSAAVTAPSMPATFNVAWLVVTAVWVGGLLGTLFRTASMDPGVLPRNPNPPTEYLTGNLTRVQTADYRGHEIQVRYNETTHFYQPPRAHHCSINDNCYDKFDHHCPWIGTTIARRNYRSFLMFVYGTVFLCGWVIAGCVIHIVQDVNDATRGYPDSARKGRVDKAVRDNWLQLLIGAYCFISLFFVGALAAMHTYLVSKNMTTYESFRIRRTGAENPFDRGCCWNWWAVCCGPIPPPRVDFR